MDWENPLRSISATVDADILRVLAGAYEPVTGNQLSRLAGRSYAQVYSVARRLVEDGLVLTARYGRTNTFSLNRDHVLAQGILRVLAAPARVENEIRQSVREWDPPPEVVALSGSAARRRTPPDGDIELLVVRSGMISRDDPAWLSQIDALARRIEHLSGNPVQLREMDSVELQDAMSSSEHADSSFVRESRTIFEHDRSAGYRSSTI